MPNYLIEHALRNVWCSPKQDNHYVIQPKRITPNRGVFNVAIVMGAQIETPVKQRICHVFQVGQMDPVSLGLLRQVPHWRIQKWFKFSDVINQSDLDVTIYNAAGVNLPRTDSYYMFTDERALIFCIPENNKFKVNFREEDIFFRFYTNYYFRSVNQMPSTVTCGYFRPQGSAEVIEMESFLTVKEYEQGALRTFVNGLLVDRARLGDLNFGDYVEWVHDSSVKKVREWRLSELHQFRSKLDNAYKYLLNSRGEVFNTIDYHDDIEIYVLHRHIGGTSRGLYYNRNKKSHHRMVTHQDYSVETETVISLRDHLAEQRGITVPDAEMVYIRAYIRDGGIRRPLIKDANRIFELYKLDEQKRHLAMIGLESTIFEWNCITLENSAYTRLMETQANEITLKLVEEAYGYNGCSVILGNTPQRMTLNGSSKTVKLPYGLTQKAVVYEFNLDGKLLTHRQHSNDDSYEPQFETCELIEAVGGELSTSVHSAFGTDNVEIPKGGHSWRLYRCRKVNQIPNNEWEDITDVDIYTVADGVVTCPGDSTQYLQLRTDKNVIAYDFEMGHNDGLLNFSLSETEYGNPLSELRPMTLPLAHLDIWMNGNKLIRNLDYFVKFPQVFVVNRTYLQQPIDTVKQRFHVRMYGLPDSSMEFDTIEDFGWVVNGQLSNNNIFDLRDDKVLQIVVGGSIYHRDSVFFAENRTGQRMLDRMNGKPYQIKDLIVPLMSKVSTDTYQLRRQAISLDKKISDYMTENFGPMGNNEFHVMGEMYVVSSPFFSHIIHLLRNNRIVLPEDRLLTDQEVMDYCQPHEGLLNYDPLGDGNTPDPTYCQIVPHQGQYSVGVSFLGYRFLQTVERLYGQGKIKISEFVFILN